MTRYPDGGKGKKWTVKELSAIKADWKGDTLNDSEGLFGEVRVSANNDISVAFRYGLKLQGKKVWHYCGTYPATNMAAIREARNKARKQVDEGINPRTKKIADRIENQAVIEATIAKAEQKRTENLTFQDLFDIWVKDGVSRLDSNKAIKMLFNKHALPTLGNIPIRKLSENDLRLVYRNIISQGKQRTAVALANDLGQMLSLIHISEPT